MSHWARTLLGHKWDTCPVGSSRGQDVWYCRHAGIGYDSGGFRLIDQMIRPTTLRQAERFVNLSRLRKALNLGVGQ